MIRICVRFLLVFAVFGRALACSPPQEAPFELEAVPIAGEVVPTEAPLVRVVEIRRGRRALPGESNCVEVAFVTLAVEDASPSAPFVYSFTQVGGNGPDQIFPDGLYLGGLNADGERNFVFYWPDIELSQKPFEIAVEVKPYSRSGKPGPSMILHLKSEI